MPKIGRQTWQFPSRPGVVATGTVGGKTESEGPLSAHLDIRHGDDRLGLNSWEHVEQRLFDEAANAVLQKSGLDVAAIDLLVGADLNAQLSGFYFGLRAFPIPALGVYSACASICEAIAVAALAIDSGQAAHVLLGTSSHNSTAERQFRYPTEYGMQKPPTAQRTVTGAAMAVLAANMGDIQVTHATIGQVTDLGVTSPWEMGAAMAPAAAATIRAHLSDTGRTWRDFDCIATGDLGRVGHDILRQLLTEQGTDVDERLVDCGMLVYHPDQPEVFSGGSGGACCALVTFSQLLSRMQSGEWKRILVAATGALLSNVTAQQGDSIPSISHAIAFERKDG